MKNKKLLNIFVLLLALLTFIADILLFAFPAYQTNAAKFLIVIFWIINSLTMVSLVLAILLTLISLFMDDYVCSKITETFVLFAFVTTLINVLTFAMTKYTLSFGYIIVCILAFLTCSISQILRLFASFKNWKSNFRTLIKPHKPVTVINAVEPKEDDMVMVDGGRYDQHKEKKNKKAKENKLDEELEEDETVEEIINAPLEDEEKEEENLNSNETTNNNDNEIKAFDFFDDEDEEETFTPIVNTVSNNTENEESENNVFENETLSTDEEPKNNKDEN